jgi:DNA-directed RNA polymerase specialized sigma24 family protein
MYEELKERLRNYKKILAKKNELELQIEELEANVGLTAMLQGDAISKTYKISSQVESQAIQLADKKDKLKQLMNSYSIEVNRIENALNCLKEWEREAIQLRYIEGRRQESVCYMMNRSWNTVKRYIAAGFKEINDILNVE